MKRMPGLVRFSIIAVAVFEGIANIVDRFFVERHETASPEARSAIYRAILASEFSSWFDGSHIVAQDAST